VLDNASSSAGMLTADNRGLPLSRFLFPSLVKGAVKVCPPCNKETL